MAVYSVTWSPQARLSYYNTLEYLLGNWTFEVVERFIDRTEEVVSIFAKIL